LTSCCVSSGRFHSTCHAALLDAAALELTISVGRLNPNGMKKVLLVSAPCSRMTCESPTYSAVALPGARQPSDLMKLAVSTPSPRESVGSGLTKLYGWG